MTGTTTESVVLDPAAARDKQRQCRNNGAIVGAIGGFIAAVSQLPEAMSLVHVDAIFWAVWGVFMLIGVSVSVALGGTVGWFVGKTKHPIIYFILINYSITMTISSILDSL